MAPRRIHTPLARHVSQPESRSLMFVVIEGIEGSGKSTLLAGACASAYDPRVTTSSITREPGGTPLGDAIREIFLDHALGLRR